MKKSMIILGVATGAVGVAGAGALATGKLSLGSGHAQSAPVATPAATADAAPAAPLVAYAEVVSVTPVSQTVTTPRQQCHKEKVTVNTKPKPKDPNNIGGTALGAAVGGLVLNQFGGGVFRALATTAGVIGGGYAGNRIQNSTHKGSTKTVTKERCVTAYDHTTVPNGYQVTYSINGQTQQVHLDHDPGRQIPLKDGQLDLSAYSSDRSGEQGQDPSQNPNQNPGQSPSPGSPAPSQAPNANQGPSQGSRPG